METIYVYIERCSVDGFNISGKYGWRRYIGYTVNQAFAEYKKEIRNKCGFKKAHWVLIGG